MFGALSKSGEAQAPPALPGSLPLKIYNNSVSGGSVWTDSRMLQTSMGMGVCRKGVAKRQKQKVYLLHRLLPQSLS